jgi:hypothetical protein
LMLEAWSAASRNRLTCPVIHLSFPEDDVL